MPINWLESMEQRERYMIFYRCFLLMNFTRPQLLHHVIKEKKQAYFIIYEMSTDFKVFYSNIYRKMCVLYSSCEVPISHLKSVSLSNRKYLPFGAEFGKLYRDSPMDMKNILGCFNVFAKSIISNRIFFIVLNKKKKDKSLATYNVVKKKTNCYFLQETI